jgi:hypothetical protein
VIETTAEVAGLLGQQLRALAALTETRQGDLSPSPEGSATP